MIITEEGHNHKQNQNHNHNHNHNQNHKQKDAFEPESKWEKTMAKYQATLVGSANYWEDRITSGILNGSISASLEDKSHVSVGDAQHVLIVFERYSWFGGNRVSLTVSLVSVGQTTRLTAITSGGSQAMFFKVNTFGEEAFLDRLIELLK